MGTFDGFISYSHAGDGLLAPRLQVGLQRFARPWWRRRALRVFRDEVGLSASPDLWGSIEGALSESEWLILLASPESASSEWVGRELEWWLEHRSVDRVLPVVTAGELGEALHPVVASAFVGEPRWVDVRWARGGSDLDLRNPSFRDVVADVAAPLHGVAKDELNSVEVREHRRLVRLVWGVGVVLVGLLVAAVVGGLVALGQRDRADEAAGVARAAEAEALSERDRADANAEVAAARADSEALARADEQTARVRAEESFDLAESRRMVADAAALVNDDPDLALLLASEAYRRAPDSRTLAGLQRVLSSTRSYLGTLGAGGSWLQAGWLADGTVAAVGPDAVAFFDGESHQELRRVELDATPTVGEPASGLSNSISIGSDAVAVGAADGSVVLVDVAGQIQRFDTGEAVSAVALDASGDRFAVGHVSGDVALWSTSGSAPMWRTRVIEESGLAEVMDPATFGAFSFLTVRDPWLFEQGPKALTFTDAGELLVGAGVFLRKLDAADGSVLAAQLLESTWLPGRSELIPGPALRIEGLRDGTVLASSWFGSMYALDADLAVVQRLAAPIGKLDGTEVHTGLAASNGIIAVGLNTGRVASADSVEGLIGADLEGSSLPSATHLAISPDGREVLVAGVGGVVHTSLDGSGLLSRAVPRGDNNDIKVSADGELISMTGFGSLDRSLYELVGASIDSKAAPAGTRMPEVTADPLSRYLVAVRDGEEGLPPLQIVNRSVDEFVGPPLPGLGVGDGWTFDGRWSVVGLRNQTKMRVNQVPSFLPVSPDLDLSEWAAPTDVWMSGFAFDPRRPRLVGALASGVAVAFDTETWEVESVYPPDDTGGIVALAYARDADVLVTRSPDGGVTVRDPASFASLREIEGTQASLQAIARGPYLSADGEYLLTARDAVPRLWHVPTGSLLGSFPNDRGRNASGAAGDQLHVATIVGDHGLVWDLDVAGWPGIACRAVGRNFTAQEWEQFGPAGEPYGVTCPEWPSGARE